MAKAAMYPLTRLQRRIVQEFPRKKLVGDIIICHDEYMVLIDYLSSVFNDISDGSFSPGIDPALVVALVQIGVKHYNGNYWSHAARELGVGNVTQHYRTAFNSCILQTLRAYNKAMVGEGKLVKNVLLHGFVSEYYADDLFNFIFAFYRLDLERDMARLTRGMLNSLIDVMLREDNTGRTYLLKKQTAEAIAANPIGSKIRIRRLLHLVDRCFWEAEIPSTSQNRLAQYFAEWQKHSAEFSAERHRYHCGATSAVRTKSFSSPFMECDLSTFTFRLQLPPQIIRFEEEHDTYWLVTTGDFPHRVPVDLMQGVTGFRTGHATLDIVPPQIFQRFEISLMSGQQRLRRFVISADCVRFFAPSGTQLIPKSLPEGEVTAFTLPEDQIISEAFVDKYRQGPLMLHSFDFQYGDIVRFPNGDSLCIGKRVEEGLLTRGRVTGAYGLTEDHRQTYLYAHPPSLLVRMLPTRCPGTRITINGTHHRLFHEAAIVLHIEDRSGEKGYVINLRDYGCEDNGTYEVDIDVPADRAVRRFEFHLIKGFWSTFEDAPYVFQPRGTLRFADNLCITQDPRTQKVPAENAYNFEIDPAEDAVEFTVEGLRIRLYVPALRWQFDDNPWQLEHPGEVWHADFPRMIRIKHPADRLTLRLDGGDKDASEEYQSETFNKRKEKHLFECDMTRFLSWFRRDATRRVIWLEIAEQRFTFITVVTRSVINSALLQAQFSAGRLLGFFDIVGRSEYFIDIQLNGIPLLDKHPIVTGSIDVPAVLGSGTYNATIYEGETDNTGFGAIDYLPIHVFAQDLVNPHDLRGRCCVIRYVKTDIHSPFLLNLASTFYIHNLQFLEPFDGHAYAGHLYALGPNGEPFAYYDVRVEFADLSRLDIIYMQGKDDAGDYVDFLYDQRRKVIVQNEDMRLRFSERYRRFQQLFDDRAGFIIEFVSHKHCVDEIVRSPVHNKHEQYGIPADTFTP